MNVSFFCLTFLLRASEMELVQKVSLIHALERENNQ